jgi:predicted deacylase
MLIVIVVVVVILLIYIISNKKLITKKIIGGGYLPDVYYIEIDKNGPNVVIVSGTHGNEPAPGYYFQQFIEKEEFSFLPPAKYYIIPFVNPSSILTYQRNTQYQPDINRSWPIINNNICNDDINRYLLPIIDSADYVFDFHEGWGNMHIDKGESVGHSIYCNNKIYIQNIYNIINDINNSHRDIWSFNFENIKMKGSLREYSNIKNITYILVEIKGQNDVAPVLERIEYTEFIFKKLIEIIK